MSENNRNNPYEDIINLPRPISKRAHMSIQDMAAQFSPFAALTGYDEEVEETVRLTDERLERNEDTENELNIKCAILTEFANEQPLIKVDYFLPDKKKDGGQYLSTIGNFKRIDEYEKKLILTNGNEILLSDIYNIDVALFNSMIY